MALIDDPLLLIPIIVGAYSAAYATYAISRASRRYERLSSERKNFIKTVLEGLRSGSITTIGDVVNVYKGVTGMSSEDFTYRFNLSRRLRELMVDVISKNRNVLETTVDDNTVRDWKQKLAEFIQQNEAISPYADLPAAERNTLADITQFLEKNDIDSAKRKVVELAGMIQARNDDMNRIRTINRWTIPLSVVGLVFTVIFGILALQ